MTGFRHQGSYRFLRTARPQALSAPHLRRDPGILQKDKTLQHSLIKLSGLSFCTANLADTTPRRASGGRERSRRTNREREGGRETQRAVDTGRKELTQGEETQRQAKAPSQMRRHHQQRAPRA